MKTLFSTLLLVFTLSFSFSQNTAIVKSASELKAIKETGKASFVLPSRLTAEEVSSKAKYYTLYFTVAFDEKSKVATINMISNDERSRGIIVRFLAACEVKDVQVGDETVSRDALFDAYLK